MANLKEVLGVAVDMMGQTMEDLMQDRVTKEEYKGSRWEEMDQLIDDVFEINSKLPGDLKASLKLKHEGLGVDFNDDNSKEE